MISSIAPEAHCRPRISPLRKRALLTVGWINVLWVCASYGSSTAFPSVGIEAARRRLEVADRFVRTFGHPTEADYGLSLVRVADGYVVAGQTSGYGTGGFNGFLTKVDLNGNLLWSKAYGTDVTEFFYHILQTQDGGLLAVGLSIHPRPDGGTPCLAVRTDADGELLWSKEFWTTDGCPVAVETQDGGFALTASGPIPSGQRHIFLIRLDQNGDLLWTKSFGGSVKETPYSLIQTSDGGFLIAGDSDSFFRRFGPYIIKTSDSGELHWSRTIDLTEAFQYRGSATLVKEISAGQFLVAGWLEIATTEGFIPEGFLLQFDSEGDMQWFGRIESPSTDNAIVGFDLTPDNQVVALASAPFLSVFAVDLSGQVLWSGRLAMLAAGNQIVLEGDGSAVVTGYTPGDPGPGPDALLLKLDSLGQTGCNNPLELKVLGGAPQFAAPPTEEGTPAVEARDYGLQVNAAMDATHEICTP